MGLKQNQGLYIPDFGNRRAMVSVTRTAKLLGRYLRAVQQRVERNTIEHHLVNGRAMIPDYAVEAELSRGRMVKFFDIYLPGPNGTLRFSSAATMKWFLESRPVGASGGWTITEKILPKWTGKPDEYFDYPDIQVYYHWFGPPNNQQDFVDSVGYKPITDDPMKSIVLGLLRDGNTQEAMKILIRAR